MSPLSRERLVVGLAPDRLSGVRQGGFRKHQVLGQHSAVLAPDGDPPWLAGLQALELLLDDPAWAARSLTVILSSHYVRYAVLPRTQRLAAAEQADLARLIFRNIFGELANEWDFRVSPARDELTLASAVPQALLSALRTACEGRISLGSIQPGVMAVFNRVRASIDREDGTLALVESGRVTLAALEDGRWQAVASRAWEAELLPELLAELGELSDMPPGGRLWLCDLTGKAVPPAAPAWRVEKLVTGASGAGNLASWGTA